MMAEAPQNELAVGQPEEEHVALDDIEIPVIKFNNKSVSADVAYETAVRLIAAGSGKWGKTNISTQDPITYAFQLSCATCNKDFKCVNPANFWSTHLAKCPATITGRVLVAGQRASLDSVRMMAAACLNRDAICTQCFRAVSSVHMFQRKLHPVRPPLLVPSNP